MSDREPPNLRDTPSCKNCKYADEYWQVSCVKYEYEFIGSQICDDYEAEAQDECDQP